MTTRGGEKDKGALAPGLGESRGSGIVCMVIIAGGRYQSAGEIMGAMFQFRKTRAPIIVKAHRTFFIQMMTIISTRI